MLLEGNAAEQVRRAVEASNVDLLTGRTIGCCAISSW
jgi:hypothetical protein